MYRFGLALLAALLISPAWADGPIRPQNMFGCTQAAQYDASTNGATQLVAASGSTSIYVCGFWFFSGGTANVSLVYGTGGTCGSGQTVITPAVQLTTQTGIVDHPPYYGGLPRAPAANDVCIKTSAGVAVQAIVYYAQF